MVDSLTYHELVRLMIAVDRQTQSFRQQADFSTIYAPDDLDHWQGEIAKNNVLYRHLEKLAIEQLNLGGRNFDSSPV